MKILISFSSQDLELVANIRERLIEAGHQIIHTDFDIKPGQIITDAIATQLKEADVFLLIVTEKAKESSWVNYELGILSQYVRENRDAKVIIPVVFDAVKPPTLISHYKYIDGDRNNIDATVEKIAIAISNFIGHKIINEEKAKNLSEKIQQSASEYIGETLKTLEQREQYFKRRANTWYFIGYLSLLLGIVATILFTFLSFSSLEPMVIIIVWGIKAAIILTLLITSSKYSFNLAKSFMNESLRNADRIHAISFGKFYLQVFEKQTTPNDIKEIFRDWNIDKPSSFLTLNSNDYDPKIAEIVMKTIDALRSGNSKSGSN